MIIYTPGEECSLLTVIMIMMVFLIVAEETDNTSKENQRRQKKTVNEAQQTEKMDIVMGLHCRLKIY